MTSFAKGGWKSLVRAVAPALATALGTPLAGLAVAAISDAVLGKPDGSEQEVEAALAVAGPDVLLRLKDADRAFTLRMRELDIDLEKVAAGDRDSARRREIDSGDKATPRALAFVVVGGFLAMVASVLLGKVTGINDPTAAGMIGTLIGYVSAKADQVISYYFGSSAGSARKDETIRRQQSGPQG